MRTSRSKESSPTRLNNNDLVSSLVKDLQFFFRDYRLYSELYPMICLIDAETLTRWKKLTIYSPDCGHDISCHNNEN